MQHRMAIRVHRQQKNKRDQGNISSLAGLNSRKFASMIAIISLPGISMASSKSLQQAIANIKIWHKGEQRAPHKPLLLLYVLAGYLNGHPRLFDYCSGTVYEDAV